MKLKGKSWKALLGIIGGVIAVSCFALLDSPTKSDRTYNIIFDLSREMRRFYISSHRLPTNLSEVNSSSYSRWGAKPLSDIWGNPIIYTITGSNTFVLKSFGPGGKPGKGNMVFTFDVTNPASGRRLETTN